MKISIKQDDLEVLYSGFVHVSNDKSTTITLDNEFDIVLKYINDEKEKGQKLRIHKMNRGIAVAITNFHNPLGTATINPVRIASTNGQTIYLTFSVTEIGKVKKVSYVLYSGKQDEDAGNNRED